MDFIPTFWSHPLHFCQVVILIQDFWCSSDAPCSKDAFSVLFVHFIKPDTSKIIPIFLINIGVPHPPTYRLTATDVFDHRGDPRIEKLKQHFILEGRVTEDVALQIIRRGAALLRDESTVLNIDAPVTGECFFRFFYSLIFFLAHGAPRNRYLDLVISSLLIFTLPLSAYLNVWINLSIYLWTKLKSHVIPARHRWQRSRRKNAVSRRNEGQTNI